MVGIERGMAESADRLAEESGFGIARKHVEEIGRNSHLADEQLAAVAHVTGPERIAAVVGLAGAGKSTMLAAARQAWEAEGYRVHGAALAGKAAEGLEQSSGIASRTLASWERGWERGFDALGSRDVFVVDEAGMVGSKQLAHFIAEADKSGAKIVLVGDPEQLQPIGAGAAFRAVAERVGLVELEGVRRQHEDWQRAASVDFGRHRTAEGLAAYEAHGTLRMEATGADAKGAIVRDVLDDMQARPDGARLVLAHRRVDVRELNQAIRQARRERGELADERSYRTAEGERAFAAGDRLLFCENNRDLGVKNGMLGTVERVEEGRIEVRLDSPEGPGKGRAIAVSLVDYTAVEHGYATTIHKSQGVTVDRAYVLASATMDRHLTYVSMTRHREEVKLYAGKDEFKDTGALSARLARAQAKETTLDYDRAGYAGRRGIELQSEIVLGGVGGVDGVGGVGGVGEKAEPQLRKRSMFDGLKLNTGRIPEAERKPIFPQRQPQDALSRAVEHYALAWSDAQRMLAKDLPVLQYQKRALHAASDELEAARPGATRDLVSALEHEPATYRAMTELQGRERTAQLVAGIKHEERVRSEPSLKAERLVKVWNGLEAKREKFSGWDQAEERGKVEARMKAVAGEIKGDSQLELVMHGRAKELGIEAGSRLDRVLKEKNLERAISRGIERGGYERDGPGWSR
jgi:hypothetical protein